MQNLSFHFYVPSENGIKLDSEEKRKKSVYERKTKPTTVQIMKGWTDHSQQMTAKKQQQQQQIPPPNQADKTNTPPLTPSQTQLQPPSQNQNQTQQTNVSQYNMPPYYYYPPYLSINHSVGPHFPPNVLLQPQTVDVYREQQQQQQHEQLYAYPNHPPTISAIEDSSKHHDVIATLSEINQTNSTPLESSANIFSGTSSNTLHNNTSIPTNNIPHSPTLKVTTAEVSETNANPSSSTLLHPLDSSKVVAFPSENLPFQKNDLDSIFQEVFSRAPSITYGEELSNTATKFVITWKTLAPARKPHSQFRFKYIATQNKVKLCQVQPLLSRSQIRKNSVKKMKNVQISYEGDGVSDDDESSEAESSDELNSPSHSSNVNEDDEDDEEDDFSDLIDDTPLPADTMYPPIIDDRDNFSGWFKRWMGEKMEERAAEKRNQKNEEKSGEEQLLLTGTESEIVVAGFGNTPSHTNIEFSPRNINDTLALVVVDPVEQQKFNVLSSKLDRGQELTEEEWGEYYVLYANYADSKFKVRKRDFEDRLAWICRYGMPESFTHEQVRKKKKKTETESNGSSSTATSNVSKANAKNQVQPTDIWFFSVPANITSSQPPIPSINNNNTNSDSNNVSINNNNNNNNNNANTNVIDSINTNTVQNSHCGDVNPLPIDFEVIAPSLLPVVNISNDLNIINNNNTNNSQPPQTSVPTQQPSIPTQPTPLQAELVQQNHIQVPHHSMTHDHVSFSENPNVTIEPVINPSSSCTTPTTISDNLFTHSHSLPTDTSTANDDITQYIADAFKVGHEETNSMSTTNSFENLQPIGTQPQPQYMPPQPQLHTQIQPQFEAPFQPIQKPPSIPTQHSQFQTHPSMQRPPQPQIQTLKKELSQIQSVQPFLSPHLQTHHTQSQKAELIQNQMLTTDDPMTHEHIVNHIPYQHINVHHHQMPVNHQHMSNHQHVISNQNPLHIQHLHDHFYHTQISNHHTPSHQHIQNQHTPNHQHVITNSQQHIQNHPMQMQNHPIQMQDPRFQPQQHHNLLQNTHIINQQNQITSHHQHIITNPHLHTQQPQIQQIQPQQTQTQTQPIPISNFFFTPNDQKESNANKPRRKTAKNPNEPSKPKKINKRSTKTESNNLQFHAAKHPSLPFIEAPQSNYTHPLVFHLNPLSPS